LLNNHKQLIVVGGPTASGKTALSIALANHYQTEIVSFDARQFYAEMNIGTAKPSEQELQQALHHFIGHKSIKESYTAGDFEKEADQLTASLFSKHNILIAVGGSGLYLDAWLNGLNTFPEVDIEVRYMLNRLYETEGIQVLQKLLKEKDAAYYRIVDKQNHRRLIRALEVCLSANKPYSSFLDKPEKIHAFAITYIGIDIPRNELYERINRRVEDMLHNGLEEEARSLYPHRHYKALHTIGYSELFDWFEKKIKRDEAIALIKQHTRNYAKRQMTWFRRYEGMIWLKKASPEAALPYLPA
jgi:tRNA dimethylallyltransferase